MKLVKSATARRNRAGPIRQAGRIRGPQGQAGCPKPATGANPLAVWVPSSQSAALRALNRTIVEYQQQSWLAHTLIEHLIRRNILLEQQLNQITNREAREDKLKAMK